MISNSHNLSRRSPIQHNTTLHKTNPPPLVPLFPARLNRAKGGETIGRPAQSRSRGFFPSRNSVGIVLFRVYFGAGRERGWWSASSSGDDPHITKEKWVWEYGGSRIFTKAHPSIHHLAKKPRGQPRVCESGARLVPRILYVVGRFKM